jgi:dihydroxy-acid dehydratase
MRSDQVKLGVERAPHRSLIKAMGFTDEQLKKPLIGIVNSLMKWCPATAICSRLPRRQRRGFGGRGHADGV